MRSVYLLPLVLLACGDDKGKVRPDAPVTPDPDAAIDAPVAVCDYTEMADATNDDLFANGTPEATGIAFDGSAAWCGTFNTGHYNTQRMNVDVDSYTFTVAAGTRGRLYLTAPGAESFDSVLIEMYAETAATFEYGQFTGNFAVLSADLPADTYHVAVSAFDPADPASTIDYKLTLVTDPADRCAKSTATASYAEANEGSPVGGGNDVYEIYYGQNSSRGPTVNPNDAPEPTGVTVASGMSYRVSGTAQTFTATPVSWQDSFQDRDMYAITTGATTNQLSIRLNWPGTTTDFDLFVFPMASLLEDAVGWYAGNMEDEFTTLAVAPNTTYWIWVGADDASTGFPIAYDLTLCGDTFTP